MTVRQQTSLVAKGTPQYLLELRGSAWLKKLSARLSLFFYLLCLLCLLESLIYFYSNNDHTRQESETLGSVSTSLSCPIRSSDRKKKYTYYILSEQDFSHFCQNWTISRPLHNSLVQEPGPRLLITGNEREIDKDLLSPKQDVKLSS